MKMQTIITDLYTFASQYKNCTNLEVIIKEKYCRLTEYRPPILFVIASGFLHGLPTEEALLFVDNNPHLIPFKNSILTVLNNIESTNPFIELTKSILYI